MISSVVTLHGIKPVGDRNYAQQLMLNLLALKAETRFYALYYDDILAKPENTLATDEQKQSTWSKLADKSLRPFIWGLALDACQWFNPDTRAQIVASLNKQLEGIDYSSSILVAHSWGSVIALTPELLKPWKHIVVMGCPLGPFSLVVKLGRKNMPDFLNKLNPVTNFFHPLDIVGSPLSGLFPWITDRMITDIGGPTWLRLPFSLPYIVRSHQQMWSSRQLASFVADLVLNHADDPQALDL